MSIASVSKSLLVTAGLTVLAVCSAHAEVKIATVNFQRLMEESVQAKAASQVLQDEFAPRQRELQQKQKDLQGKQDKLSRDGATMAEKDRTTLEKDLQKGQRELQSEGEAFTEEVNTRRNEELNKLQALLVTEIQGFAKTGTYDLVIPTSVAVYAKDSFDITPQVLTYLQSRPVNAPPAKPAAATSSSKPAVGTKPAK